MSIILVWLKVGEHSDTFPTLTQCSVLNAFKLEMKISTKMENVLKQRQKHKRLK